MMTITLLRGGGGDAYYELGLLSGLVKNGLHIDYIGSDTLQDAEILGNKKVSSFNFRQDQNPDAPKREKISRIFKYYIRVLKYAANTDSKVIHIQWLNKFIYFDRTFVNIYYKILGKKLLTDIIYVIMLS